jgi:hypothetical protein
VICAFRSAGSLPRSRGPGIIERAGNDSAGMASPPRRSVGVGGKGKGKGKGRGKGAVWAVAGAVATAVL